MFLLGFVPAVSGISARAADDGPSPPDHAASLVSFLDAARANNPEIRAAREKARAAEERAKVEGAYMDPKFRVEWMGIPRDNVTLDPARNEQTWYTVTQDLPFPGKLGYRREAAVHESRAAAESAGDVENGVLRRVKQAYLDQAFLHRSLAVTREVKGLLSSLASVAATRYAAGLVSQQDVLKAQVELSLLANEEITLVSQIRIARARLNTLLNRAPGSPLASAPWPRGRIAPDAWRNAGEPDAAKSPSARMAAAEADAGRAMREAGRLEWAPDFMLGLSAVQMGDRQTGWNVMAGMTLPVWFGKNRAAASSAAAFSGAAEAKASAARNDVSYEVSRLKIEIESAERRIDLYDTSLVPQSEAAFRSALINYETGKIDFLSLLENERNLKRVRLERERALAEYFEKIADLERTLGVDLGMAGGVS
ncbi:MAG: hypothetical protein A2V83_09670 [Nitrospirae bacterium RBG_16_64_22]|nr:MAG: hypothetical protein A2V83_09670 [Nitrospirae bacterium RBG_16_64_22]